jgi:16S rRNA processing protein RimM
VDEPTVVVGRIAKAHGLNGEVAVESRTDNPDRWTSGSTLFDDAGRSLVVRSVRPHGDRLLVTFEGIEDRDAAASLAGRTLVVPESWLPSLEEGQWWAFQIEGCAVTTESGRALGRVDEVLAYPAHDIWRVVGEDGVETLIPAVEAFIVSVDTAARTAVVRDVAGLTAPDES